MAQRIAVSLALVSFAVCLLVGGLEAGNTFATTVWRALLAMGATLVIGLILGTIARIMLEENLKVEEEKIKNESVKS